MFHVQKKKNLSKNNGKTCRNIPVLFPSNLFFFLSSLYRFLFVTLSFIFIIFAESKFNVVQICVGTCFITSSNSRQQKIGVSIDTSRWFSLPVAAQGRRAKMFLPSEWSSGEN